MAENAQSGDVSPETSSATPNIDPDYRPDVWPQDSRYVVNGLLGIILVIAAGYLFTQWPVMGPWSIVSGLLFLVAAFYVVSFSFRLK